MKDNHKLLVKYLVKSTELGQFYTHNTLIYESCEQALNAAIQLFGHKREDLELVSVTDLEKNIIVWENV